MKQKPTSCPHTINNISKHPQPHSHITHRPHQNKIRKRRRLNNLRLNQSLPRNRISSHSQIRSRNKSIIKMRTKREVNIPYFILELQLIIRKTSRKVLIQLLLLNISREWLHLSLRCHSDDVACIFSIIISIY